MSNPKHHPDSVVITFKGSIVNVITMKRLIIQLLWKHRLIEFNIEESEKKMRVIVKPLAQKKHYIYISKPRRTKPTPKAPWMP